MSRRKLEVVELVEPLGVVEHQRVGRPVAVVEVLARRPPRWWRCWRRSARARSSGALVVAERRVADLGGAAAHQRDRPVAGLLQPAQHHDVEQVPDVQRRRGGVVADIGRHDARAAAARRGPRGRCSPADSRARP